MKSDWIESLESRSLLSASPALVMSDRAHLVADFATFKAALVMCGKNGAADTNALSKATRKYGAAGRALAAKFKSDAHVAAAILSHDYAAMVKSGSKEVAIVLRSVSTLAKKPGNPTATAQLGGALAVLSNNAAVTKFATDWIAAGEGETQEVTTAAALNPLDPVLQEAITTAQNHATACGASADAAALKVHADLNQLITDASE
jgi:hypothetical protein